MVITGTYNLQVDTAWRNIQQQDVYLECDTTNEPVTINLFAIAELERFWGVRLYISDISNNANENNITVNTGGVGDPIVYDTIDEEGNNQITLNVNGESVAMKVVSETSWLATESVGASSDAPNLQAVTEIGNSTSSDLQLLKSASFILSNNSKIAKGSKDNYEIGGGISQVCSLEKELQWEGGVQYYFEQGQPIIHANSINNIIPDNTYDETKSFQVGSTFTVLNTGLTYICTDVTTDNAVWVLKSYSLQNILDYNHDLVDGNNFQGTGAGDNNSGQLVIGIGENTSNANEGSHVNAIGSGSAITNKGSFVNAFGTNVCNNNQGDYITGLGFNSLSDNIGNNVVGIGSSVGVGNELSNSFIIANTELPSYADYATASLAITVLNGAVANNTYLFYNEDTNSIGAVRL